MLKNVGARRAQYEKQGNETKVLAGDFETRLPSSHSDTKKEGGLYIVNKIHVT